MLQAPPPRIVHIIVHILLLVANPVWMTKNFQNQEKYRQDKEKNGHPQNEGDHLKYGRGDEIWTRDLLHPKRKLPLSGSSKINVFRFVTC